MKNEKLIIAALAGVLTSVAPSAAFAEEGKENHGCNGNSCEGKVDAAAEVDAHVDAVSTDVEAKATDVEAEAKASGDAEAGNSCSGNSCSH